MKVLLIILAICFISDLFHTDSTDKGFIKSGLGLYIDNATGCHYLSEGLFGGITPRLDKNGNHICSGYEFEKQNKGK